MVYIFTGICIYLWHLRKDFISFQHSKKYNMHTTYKHSTTQHINMDIQISTYKRKKTNLIQESYEQQNQVDHYLQSLAMCIDDGSPV